MGFSFTFWCIQRMEWAPCLKVWNVHKTGGHTVTLDLYMNNPWWCLFHYKMPTKSCTAPPSKRLLVRWSLYNVKHGARDSPEPIRLSLPNHKIPSMYLYSGNPSTFDIFIPNLNNLVTHSRDVLVFLFFLLWLGFRRAPRQAIRQSWALQQPHCKRFLQLQQGFPVPLKAPHHKLRHLQVPVAQGQVRMPLHWTRNPGSKC